MTSLNTNDAVQQVVSIRKVENGYAWVSSVDDSVCSSCSSKSSCSSTNLLKPLLEATLKNEGLRVANTLEAAVGDQVVIELGAKSLLKITMLTYLLPLLGLIVFAWIGQTLFGQSGFGETPGIISGLSGLFVGLYLVKRRLSASRFQRDIEPVMVETASSQSNDWRVIRHKPS